MNPWQNSLKLGRGIDVDTTQGPLVNAVAARKVTEHVRDAVSKCASLHNGGKVLNCLAAGYFFEPTVITGATTDMEVAHDETFGPLAAIFAFNSEQQTIELANTTEYGFAGYFFSENIGRVMRVARKLQCGMVCVNTVLISAAESPLGGQGEWAWTRRKQVWFVRVPKHQMLDHWQFACLDGYDLI